MRTLLVDRTTWDLVIDAGGNLAVADDPYSQAQDAASMIKLFQGELYYDDARGVPYFGQILGKAPPVSYMRQKFIDAAKTVPGVLTAACFISSIRDRVVTGQVQVTNADSRTSAATFGTPALSAAGG